MFLLNMNASSAELHIFDVVYHALKKNTDIQIQEHYIAIAQGQHLQAVGQFDWVLSSLLNYDKKITPQFNNPDLGLINSGYQLGLSKPLRNGMILSSRVDAMANDEGMGRAQQNQLKLDISLLVPLLKGSGPEGIAAEEDVAKLNIELSRYQLRDRISQTLYNTILAYWNYRNRVELEKVAISSEERSQSLLLSIQKLVDAAEKPRADLVLLKADHGDKVARRQAAVLASTEARTVLGRLLGLDALGIRQLPEPSDALPAVLDIAYPLNVDAMSAAALLQRPDIQALAMQLEAAKRQMQAVQDRLKPQLNLTLGLGYAKASEGGGRYSFAAESGQFQATPSVFARLNFQFPMQNNAANGAVQEHSALMSQLVLRQRDLSIGIATGVETALQSLFNTAEQIKLAKEGLSLYELAVSQEVIKQKNGISTLIDVINTEARFVSARVNYLQLQLAYASALARLRFETGTFLPAAGGNDMLSLDMNDLAGLGPLITFLPSLRAK
ncbi:TolC family protein [Janthinobacterium sp. B9-8]|uniref:TolC family protein n=1 Tax=Janthinobacterium sp. B9-8 TaxID=1236179 RepID=UPI0018D20947|nr:TolC family protein [Janthinobacterium sp. B9-8]